MSDLIAAILDAGICDHELRETSKTPKAIIFDEPVTSIDLTCDECGYDITVRWTADEE